MRATKGRMLDSIAAKVRARVLAYDDRFWRPEDFEASPSAVDKALSRLVEEGKLRRIRRGLYWRGTPTLLGMAPPDLNALVAEVAGDLGIGPADRSAALVLGLSTQVPRDEIVAVPSRPPRPVPGVRFVWRDSPDRRDFRLNQLEVALLEVLRDWSRLVETPNSEAVRRISDLFDSEDIRSTTLTRAARDEPARVREGLRSLLIRMGRHAEAERVPRSRSRISTTELALAS